LVSRYQDQINQKQNSGFINLATLDVNSSNKKVTKDRT